MVFFRRERAVYNWRAYLGLKTWQKLIFFIIFFIILAFVIDLELNLSTILSASSFLFSILVGFFIAGAMGNFSRLKTLVSQETGGLTAVYHLTSMTDVKLGEKVADVIDRYVIARFDWELENYVEKTDKEFFAIFDVLKSKKFLSNDVRIQNAPRLIFNSLTTLPAVRNEIAVVGKSTLNYPYWILLYSLATVVILSLYGSIGTEITSKISTILLASAVIFVLLVLDEIDKNKLNEHDIAFLGYNELLEAIGKPKYFLEVDAKAGRVKLPKDEPYRLGIYKNFPYSFEKEIKLIMPMQIELNP